MYGNCKQSTLVTDHDSSSIDFIAPPARVVRRADDNEIMYKIQAGLITSGLKVIQCWSSLRLIVFVVVKKCCHGLRLWMLAPAKDRSATATDHSSPLKMDLTSGLSALWCSPWCSQ